MRGRKLRAVSCSLGFNHIARLFAAREKIAAYRLRKRGMMQKKETIWNPVFISVFVANFCQQMGQQMMNTLVPKYADSLGAAASTVGLVTSVFAITALAVRPISSPALDSFSKRKLLMAAQLCVFAAFIGYSLADGIEMIVAARVLHGIGSGVTAPLCLALASNSLPDSKIGSGIGIFSLGQAVAQAVGPNIGLTLSESLGYSKTFLIGAAVLGMACVLSFFIKEPPMERPKYKISLDRMIAKGAVRPAVLMFFLGMAFSCIGSFIAIYGGERGVDNIGLYFTAYAGTMLITRPVCGRLVDKYGFDKVLIPGILCFAAAFFLISIADSLSGFILAGVVGAFGYGVCQPTVQSLCMRCVPKEQRGAAGSTNYIGMDLGALLGPVISGSIVDSLLSSSGNAVYAYSNMFRIMTVPMFIALIYLLIVKNKIKRDIGDIVTEPVENGAESGK